MAGYDRACVKTRGRRLAVGADITRILTSTYQVESGCHAEQENRGLVGKIFASVSQF